MSTSHVTKKWRPFSNSAGLNYPDQEPLLILNKVANSFTYIIYNASYMVLKNKNICFLRYEFCYHISKKKKAYMNNHISYMNFPYHNFATIMYDNIYLYIIYDICIWVIFSSTVNVENSAATTSSKMPKFQKTNFSKQVQTFLGRSFSH